MPATLALVHLYALLARSLATRDFSPWSFSKPYVILDILHHATQAHATQACVALNNYSARALSYDSRGAACGTSWSIGKRSKSE